jgi:membrane-associated protease RseP (regulator of RpoE activity)
VFPLFLLAPVEGFLPVSFSVGWWPFFADVSALFLFTVPVMAGYGGWSASALAHEEERAAASVLFLHGAAVVVLAVLARFWPPVAVFGFVVALLGHLLLSGFVRLREQRRLPLFVQEGNGVRVHAVIPHSPAAQMGLCAADTIVKVNGVVLRHPDELYPALQRNPAFCKIEALNREGTLKLLQRSVYEGDHHQLGIIPAPSQGSAIAPRMSGSDGNVANERGHLREESDFALRGGLLEVLRQRVGRINKGA